MAKTDFARHFMEISYKPHMKTSHRFFEFDDLKPLLRKCDELKNEESVDFVIVGIKHRHMNISAARANTIQQAKIVAMTLAPIFPPRQMFISEISTRINHSYRVVLFDRKENRFDWHRFY